MVSSDDEVEAVTQSVTNYYFEDDQYEPISFSVLPIKWSESDSSALVKENVFLNGITDSGSERIYKKVLAWKLEFSYEKPEVAVLSEEKSWIKLQKPRKSFEDTIRTILITIHCLHFFRKHPGNSESSMWSYLKKVFSSYNVKPCETDLLDHLPLIKAAVKQDKTFAKIKFMLTFCKDLKKRKEFDEDIHHDLVLKKTKSITEDDKEFNEETGVNDLCDDVCALCDNGGEILCCEGRCLRSFHATVAAGFESGCKSLGLSKDQLKATQKFLCMNCQYNQHQCFACGKLGSSDRYNNAEVFRCASATCGHFYHPRCVAKLLHPINELAAEHMQRKIFAGESFTCTVHKCFMCKREENKDVRELQFAICRRCPKVYHRKCLPREISFESILNEGILQRAWDKLLPNRILIYCLKHDIDVSTLTPKGNGIIFPDVQHKTKICPPDLQPSQGKMVAKRTSLDSRNHPQRDTVSQLKEVVKMPCAIKHHNSTKIHVIDAKQASQERFGSTAKSQLTDASRSHLKDRVKCISLKLDRSSSLDETNVPLKEENLNQVWNKAFEMVKSKKQGVVCSNSKKTMRCVPVTKKSSSASPFVRTETEMRKVDLTKQKSSSKTMEIVTKSRKEAFTQAYLSDNVVDKAILQGNADVKAVEASVLKLEDYSFDDPKANYEPEILNQAYSDNVVEKAIPQGNMEGSVKAVETSVQKLEGYSFGDPKANYKPEIFNQAYSSDNVVEKAIPQGNVEGSVKAVEASVQNLEDYGFDDPKANYKSKIFNQAYSSDSAVERVEGSVKSLQAVEASVQNLEDYGFDDPKANYKSKIFNQAYSSDSAVERVEGSVKAVEASVQKLEDYSFDGLKANYEPEVFNHLTKSKIADKLLCYAVPGDTILNVCCRDNGFSCLMRQKLEETGKKCPVKNIEDFQSKGGFDFKKEDWMPTSSRLIIGLIFPYGVEGVPVNVFIDKVLEFNPKLLVLICPQETISLGEKESLYDLIWEEAAIFSSRSNVRARRLNEQMDRRTSESPLLYLWSRYDWTKTSKKTALEQGHISNEHKDPNMVDETNYLTDITNQTNNLPEKLSSEESHQEAGEIIIEEPMDTFVNIESNTVDTSRQEAGEIIYEEPMDASVNIESNTVGTSRPHTVFIGNLFAPGLLQFCSNRSCGWLDE